MQFGSLAVVTLLLAVYPPRYPGSGYIVAGLSRMPRPRDSKPPMLAILAIGGIVSGHSLKHMVAAGGVACIVAMLRARRTARHPRSMNATLRIAAVSRSHCWDRRCSC